MNLLEVMAALYESEINCGVASFWDAGFDMWLGDDANGKKAVHGFYPDDFAEAGKWLREAALKYYPDSEYAKRGGSEKTEGKGKERKAHHLPEEPR